MWRASALSMLLLSSTASANIEICTTVPANEALDRIQSNKGEVPILKMKLAGDIEAILVANPDGDFALFRLHSSGRACIVAIGNGMTRAEPAVRFPAQRSQ